MLIGLGFASCASDEERVVPRDFLILDPSAGLAGSEVTISGFSKVQPLEDPVVMFGDKEAKVLRFDSEVLIVEAPGEGVTAPITVQTKSRKIPGPLFTYYEVTAVTSAGLWWADTVRVWKNEKLAYTIAMERCMDAKFHQGNLYLMGILDGQFGYRMGDTFVPVDSIDSPRMEILDGEVYIVGTSSKVVNSILTILPAYWHEGEIVRLPLDSGFTGGQATTIGLDDGHIYVGGHQCTDCGSEFEQTGATVWKDLVPDRLVNEANPYPGTSIVDLAMVDGVVYAVSNPVALWIDGVWSAGAASDFYPVAISIEIVRGDVYIAGAELRYGYHPVAKVWKNDVPGKVTDDKYNSVYHGIRIIGKDAFVLGTSYYKLNNRAVPVGGYLFDIRVDY